MANRLPRKLTAILYADVAGYSRLTGEDEDETHRTLSHYLDLISATIESHRGQVMHYAGDAVLARFDAVADALSSAANIQNEIYSHNDKVPQARKVQFRIGVNLGDVIEDRGEIYGDGVNIAARLQGLSDPGGICISDAVRSAVGKKLDFDYEDMGAQEVKNIADPVRAYKVVMTKKVAVAETVKPEPKLPDRPSIAVLPFTNMSGDPEQEYFSDGMTEDIITELSRFHTLFVISRNSTFHYKRKSPKAQELSRELGVQYIVEGSVRNSGNRVRITAQLVEADSGNHLWAERYDREMNDVFEVQDEVVGEIARAIPGQLETISIQRTRRAPVENLTAYDLVLRGEWTQHGEFGSDEALEFFERAIDVDPQCARAHIRLATVLAYRVFSRGESPEENARKAQFHAERALEIDPDDPLVQAVLSSAYILVGSHELARQHIMKATSLNPNDSSVMRWAALVHAYLGENDEGMAWMRRFQGHNPNVFESIRETYFDIYYIAHQYDAAVDCFKGWRSPPPHMHAELAAAYAQLDRMEEAVKSAERFRQLIPLDAGVELLRLHARMCAQPKDRDHWLDGYRKAGFSV